MDRITLRVALPLVAGALVALGATAPAEAAPTPSSWSVDGIDISGILALSACGATTADVLTYIQAHPVLTTSDAGTGSLLSVAPASEASERTSFRTNFQSTDAFWGSAATPYGNNCSYGSAGQYVFPTMGTRTAGFKNGKYSARHAWLSGTKTIWSARTAPGSTDRLTAVVRAKGAQIY